MRVVDYLGDLHELDAGRDTVKTGHSVPQLLSKEEPAFLAGSVMAIRSCRSVIAVTR